MLCCKEVSPGKSKDKKDKTKSTGPKVRNRNAKLQLKGRIFMTNVTDVVAMSKTGWFGPNLRASRNRDTNRGTGSYTVQIWWKGDPGVENFMIKFSNEQVMKKWAAGLDQQRKENAPQSAQSPDQPPPNFAWMQSQVSALENPYAQQDDDDEEDSYGVVPTPSQYGGPAMAGTMPRNASSSSLRGRASTAESTQSLAGIARAPPPRFPLPQPPAPLSLQTQMPPGQQSPGPQGVPNGNSYFSPTAESPASSRTSTASSFFPNAGYPFPQTGMHQSGVWEDSNRYTAPAMPHAPSRDGPSPVNAYGMVSANGRNPRGPSLPAMASQSASQLQQQRSRSYSTPDINGQPINSRRQNGQSVPAVPGIPAHLHHPAHERHDSNIPRSNTGSPRNDLPIRSSTQSPGAQQRGGTMTKFPSHPIYPRQSSISNGSVPMQPPPLAANEVGRTDSPPLGHMQNSLGSPGQDIPLPTQLKVKVNCDSGNYVTLVVAFNITYQSLIDRIDAKLNRFTTSSVAKGNLKLRYQDEDGDFVTLESDDDIQIAISEWREGMASTAAGPQGVGEIELFCVGEMN